MSEWRPVPGFSGNYEVCSTGAVRRVGAENPLKPTPSHGYQYVTLYDSGRPVRSKIGRLVLRAFVGDPKPGQECCHQNGVRNDDRLENLRWDSRSNNSLDKRLHGTAQRGERNGNTTLSEADATAILNSAASTGQLAKLYGVDIKTIINIRNGATWAHLPRPVPSTAPSWRRPPASVWGDGWRLDDRHVVICLDPEDGEMGIKRDGVLWRIGIFPSHNEQPLAPVIRKIVPYTDARRTRRTMP